MSLRVGVDVGGTFTDVALKAKTRAYGELIAQASAGNDARPGSWRRGGS